MHTTTLETCANCGATIGKLETPCVWREQVVCAACHARLPAAVIPYASPAPPLLPQAAPMRSRSRRSDWQVPAAAILMIFGPILGCGLAMFGFRGSLPAPAWLHMHMPTAGELGVLAFPFGLVWLIVAIVRGVRQ